MYTVYGIPNCDSVKKALDWFKAHHIAFEFHDYKKKGIAEGQLKKWVRQVGSDILLNKKSTTWRELDEAIKASIASDADAIQLMRKNTSLIKRPVIEQGNKVIEVGFDEASYITSFGS
ncbi:MAG: arsenate reductase [Chitinophagaceae bacterium]|nr:arsenate reductase [Chitinophagaceae bacterium]